MTEKRTAVDENRYLYTTEVNHDGFPDFIAVQWTALSFTPTDAFLAPLRSYLRPRHEVSEVWLVFPKDLLHLFKEVRESERFAEGAKDLVPRVYRFFSVDLNGHVHEEPLAADQDVRPVTDSEMTAAIDDGLRQLFRDTDSLATAAAGFHFAHPSGSHSEHFIRASQSVSRLSHTYFVAMALLRLLRPSEADLTIWVDTASISQVGYAWADLLRRGGLAGSPRIETFGGYNGLSDGLRPGPADLVLVSGSTSGSLARQVVTEKRVPLEQVVTLFYLGKELPSKDAGLVLCDLTNRDENPHPSVREARVVPYATFQAAACDICVSGSGEIRLEGDSFFPATSQLDLRMPTYADRPLDGISGPREQLIAFDGSNYFADLFGLNAITFDAGTPVDGSPHGVSTRLGHLLGGQLSEKVGATVDAALKGTNPVVAVVSLLDDDSTELGKFLAQRHLGLGRIDNLGTPAKAGMSWREWRKPGGEGLADIANGGTILVCAAVVGSGRSLTAVARELRKVPGEFDTRYFVAAAHPESSTTWEMLTKTLQRVSVNETSKLNEIWRLPREPRLPDAKSPWSREEVTLTAIGAWLGSQPKYKHLVTCLEPRLLELGKLDSNTLFVGAVDSIAQVNRNFALWPFDWTTHSVDAVPTHAEIYATVAHLLYESRRRSPRIESRNITARRHGYALHPAVFDRFNDPIIQAALLRAAEPGELHYTTDADASRAVSDLLWFVLSNVGLEAGDAAYEFLLALCEGCDHEDAPGMRIDEQILRSRLEHLESPQHQGPNFAKMELTSPRVRALLLYLRARVDPSAG